MTSFKRISALLFILLVPRIDSSDILNVPKHHDLKNSTHVAGSSKLAQTVQEHNQSAIKHVIVATLESAPFMMKRLKDNQNETYEWYGYCMDLFNELIKHLPYEVTYEIYQVQDNKFGSKTTEVVLETDQNSNRSVYRKFERWTGLIGDLQQGKTHLALAPLAVMAERELVMDFTVPFYDLVGIQILLKKPDVPQDWFKFLTVLDNEVWFSLTVAYFFTSFTIFLFDRLSPYSHKNLSRIKKLRQSSRTNKKWSATSNARNAISLNKGVPDSLAENEHGARFLEKPGGGKELRCIRKLSGTCHLRTNPPFNHRSAGLPELSCLSSNKFDHMFRSGYIDTVNPEMIKSDAVQLQTSRKRGSTSFSEYIRGIDLRAGLSGPASDECDSSDFDDGKPDFGLRDSLWFCITSLTPQGGGEAPQNLSGRIVAGAWWLFCFIIIASYTANLAAFLTVSRLDIPIENLDDLVKQYRIKYAPVDGTAEQTYFKRMAYIEEIFYNIWKEMSLNNSLSEEERSKFAVWDYPISDKYTKIWSQIQQVGMPEDTEAGIQRVKSSNIDDGFALLADANVIKHAIMTDCSLKAVGDEFSRKPIALGVRKGDEKFRDDLSYAILQLINQRYMEILREKWWTNNPKRLICSNIDESEGINMENIGGVFIIIFTGVALSFLAWAIERLVYKTKIDVSLDLMQRL